MKDGWILKREDVLDPLLSRKHFRLFFKEDSWHIQDFNSTNKTYVNQVPIAQSALKSGDVIEAGSLQMICLDNLLFSSQPLPLPSAKTAVPVDFSGKQMPPLSFQSDALNWPLELPVFSVPAAKPHWFSMIGSSLMIGVSALASMAAMAITSPNNPEMMLTSGMTSFGMAGAFLGYGLIQNKIQQDAAAREAQNKLALYENYLLRQKQILQSKRQERDKEFLKQKQLLNAIDPALKSMFSHSDWILPVGLKKETWLHFDHLPLRYDQLDTPQARLLCDFEAEFKKENTWVTLSKNQSLQIPVLHPKEMEKLFGLWAWLNWNENRHWIWILDSASCLSESILEHPACSFQNQPLVFSDLNKALALAASHSDKEWVVFCTKAQEAILPDNCALIVSSSVKTASLPFVQPILLDPVQDLSFLRLQRQKDSFSSQKPWHFLLDPSFDCADAFRSCSANLKVFLSDEVIWDLKEDGPHALIAGTTGSGKSEGMTCLLLQLALNNSSRYLQYMLIDFKGGAFGQIFYEFDHLAGSVTNLEKNSFDRFEKALNLELERRQKKMALFAKNNPLCDQNIDSYNACCPQDPISHLFVIVDEFAELKRQQPQAMGYLQQTARIGRSLGVHLILATQKPGGVVDDQIWSNTQSRLCFRVSSAMESREVLNHDKAAGLTQPGEFILQHSGAKPDQNARAWYSRMKISEDLGLRLHHPQTGRITDFSSSFTPLEKISSLIHRSAFQRRWILQPFDPDQKGDAPVLVDRIDHFQELHPSSQESWWILAPAKSHEILAQNLAAFCEHPVLTFNFACKSLQMLGKENLWQLHQIQKEVLLLVKMDDQMDPALLCLWASHPKIKLVVLSDDFRPAWHKAASGMQRFACGISDRQLLFELFNQSVPAVHAYPHFIALIDAHLESGQFCRPKTQTPINRQTIDLVSMPLSLLDLHKYHLSFALGFDEMGQPLYWSRQKQILFVCATEAGKRMASSLMELLLVQDPMLQTGPLQSLASLTFADVRDAPSASLLSKTDLENKTIVWCGSQLGSYAWQLKLSHPPQKNAGAYFIESGVCIGFEPLTLQEKEPL